MKLYNIVASLIGLLILLVGCKEKADPVIPNEEELITTLIYTLIAQNQPDTVVMRFQDLDGDGGNPPIIIGGTLKTNTFYAGTLQVLNEQETPANDITLEVIAEAEEHQFFLTANNGLDASIIYDDADQDGNPLGVASTLSANALSAGKLTITLRHEPDKFAAGVDAGDITNAGGETDVEVTFDVDIQ